MDIRSLDYWASSGRIGALHAMYSWSDDIIENVNISVRWSSGYHDDVYVTVKVNVTLSYSLGEHYATEYTFKDRFQEYFEEIADEVDDVDISKIFYEFNIRTIKRDHR